MEALAGVTAFVGTVFFLLSILILIEFFLMGHRLHKIRQELENHTPQLEQQNAHLAAISANLAALVNLVARSPVGPAPGSLEI